ncbi:hypothetical protein [Clostridium botulinum]|uniref:hypothetical protein n=1 Tax=Clostridium botulinum TaxID=1491 RepID=UPI000AC600C7|nr:hypothetical protein [Clostridium botulinum]
MFNVKYNSHSKEYIVYKEDTTCAIMKNNNLHLINGFIFSIADICKILDKCNYSHK